ncbi:hypothetical protein EYE40_03320 [Glaciihabitans arcticus]|uniref:Uncharacterized protein n=1 Tax=Glaciihabitans arcticus TaxID=2668039 RepID=A0A4Q9GP47_9MICO|nr:hypothetical protein [Glaciihabitans arcticus]TBN56506.1 hypothetical protein EYE40_03320 [Glaciihabitans arcticus]
MRRIEGGVWAFAALCLLAIGGGVRGTVGLIQALQFRRSPVDLPAVLAFGVSFLFLAVVIAGGLWGLFRAFVRPLLRPRIRPLEPNPEWVDDRLRELEGIRSARSVAGAHSTWRIELEIAPEFNASEEWTRTLLETTWIESLVPPLSVELHGLSPAAEGHVASLLGRPTRTVSRADYVRLFGAHPVE